MKRLLFVALVCGLATVPSLGAPSLGFWDEGAPGSTHLFWNLESNYVLETIAGKSFVADLSEEAAFPPGGIHSPIAAAIISGTGLTYNAAAGSFSSPNAIDVHLKINNFPAANAFKAVWVDFIGSGTTDPTGIMALDGGATTFTYVPLAGPGPGTGADFGWSIRPNPFYEEVEFSVVPAGGPTGRSRRLACRHDLYSGPRGAAARRSGRRRGGLASDEAEFVVTLIPYHPQEGLQNGCGNPSCFCRVIIDSRSGRRPSRLAPSIVKRAADGSAARAADRRRPFVRAITSFPLPSSAAWSTDRPCVRNRPPHRP